MKKTIKNNLKYIPVIMIAIVIAITCSIKMNMNSSSDKQEIINNSINNYKVMALGLEEETEENKSLNVNVKGETSITMNFLTIAYENTEENINNLKVSIDEYNGLPASGRFSIGLYGSDELLTDFSQATEIYKLPTAASECYEIREGKVEEIYLNVNTENLNYKYLYIAVRVYGGSTYDGNFNYNITNLQLRVNNNISDNVVGVTEKYGTPVTYEQEIIKSVEEGEQPSTSNTVYLIGQFGQSNSVGRGTQTRPDDMSNNAILVDIANDRITYGNLFADKTSSSPQFASHLAKLSGELIAVVKSATSGTSIGSPTDPTWNANVEGSLADKAISDYKQAVEVLEDLGYQVVQVGYVWTQGEADYSEGYSQDYEQNLTDLINKFRNEISPDFKVLINLVGDRNEYDGAPYRSLETIRNAQINVSKNMEEVYVVSDIAPRFVSTDLNLIQDQWHYTNEGYIMLGTQSAEYVYKYLFNNVETSTTELENYKQEKIQFATNYTTLDSSSEVKALVDTAINKINLDTTQTKVMVDEIISDLDFSVGASLLKQNVISEINKYNSNNNSESLNNLISTTLLEVEDAVTVYEIESASFEALSKIKTESVKEAAINELTEYIGNNYNDEIKLIYEEAVRNINNVTNPDEISKILKDAISKVDSSKNSSTINDSITNESTNNPNTGDNIMNYGILLLIGLIGVISTYKFIFKKKKTLENN